MQTEQIIAHALTLKGAEHEYKANWEAHVLTLCGKMFAMLGGDKQGTPILSVKCDPVDAEFLRGNIPGVTAGYYLNKLHWVSVYYSEYEFEDAFLEGLIRQSYELILHGLPKKKQAEIQQSV